MFVLSPMLQQLAVRAESRALALAEVTVSVHVGWRCDVMQRTLRPVLPTIDHEALLKLIHLDLIANPPGAAVVGISVTAETNRPSRAQLGLFSPQFPEPMRLEVTLARLAAVVGSAERVGAPELVDSHHRDAFRMRHFAAPEESKTKTVVVSADRVAGVASSGSGVCADVHRTAASIRVSQRAIPWWWSVMGRGTAVEMVGPGAWAREAMGCGCEFAERAGRCVAS